MVEHQCFFLFIEVNWALIVGMTVVQYSAERHLTSQLFFLSLGSCFEEKNNAQTNKYHTILLTSYTEHEWMLFSLQSSVLLDLTELSLLEWQSWNIQQGDPLLPDFFFFWVIIILCQKGDALYTCMYWRDSASWLHLIPSHGNSCTLHSTYRMILSDCKLIHHNQFDFEFGSFSA